MIPIAVVDATFRRGLKDSSKARNFDFWIEAMMPFIIQCLDGTRLDGAKKVSASERPVYREKVYNER